MVKRVQAKVLSDALAHTIAEMESEKFGDMKVEILVVTKTIADTLTCVEAKAPFKTEGNTLVAVQKDVEANSLL